MVRLNPKLSIGVPFLNQEVERTVSLAVDCRTVRDFNKLSRQDISFDLLKNKAWELRLLALDKFVQSARRVILKNRIVKVLQLLRKFIASWNETLSEPYIANGAFLFSFYQLFKNNNKFSKLFFQLLKKKLIV